MIDWQFLFLAWELKGKYPAILDQPVARELFDDANTLLDEIIADGSFQARGVYGFWPAHSRGRRHRARRRRPVPDAAPADREAGRPGQPLPGRLHRAGRRPPRRVRGGHPRRRRAGRALRGRARRLPRDHGQGAGRPAGRGVRRVHPPAGPPRLVRAGRRAGAGGPARRAVPRHPAGARLPGQPRPQREAGAVRPARHATDRHRPDRVVRDDPGRRRQRPDLRPPGRRATSPSAGSARTRSPTTRPGAACRSPRSSAGCAPTSPTSSADRPRTGFTGRSPPRDRPGSARRCARRVQFRPCAPAATWPGDRLVRRADEAPQEVPAAQCRRHRCRRPPGHRRSATRRATTPPGPSCGAPARSRPASSRSGHSRRACVPRVGAGDRDQHALAPVVERADHPVDAPAAIRRRSRAAAAGSPRRRSG